MLKGAGKRILGRSPGPAAAFHWFGSRRSHSNNSVFCLLHPALSFFFPPHPSCFHGFSAGFALTCSVLSAPQLGALLLKKPSDPFLCLLPLRARSLGQKSSRGVSFNWNKPERTWVPRCHVGPASRLVCEETATCLMV